MHRTVRCALALLLSVPGIAVAHAQTLSEPDQAAVVQALNRGQLLHAFDQAAWHATDKMLDDARATGRLDALKAQLGGWVVQPSRDATLEVIFFDRNAAAPNRIYAARLADGGTRVISSGFAEQDAAISDPATLRLIAARAAALTAIERTPVLLCNSQPFNIAVLPPDTPDGPIPVYVLTAQSDLDHVPFGGHTRIMVSADGQADAMHPFTKACMDLPTRQAKGAPTALVATQLLDPLPTEVAVFTMLAAGLPLYVATPDQRIWVVEQSAGQARIRLLPANMKPGATPPR